MSSTRNGDRVQLRHDRVIWRTVDDEVIVLDRRSWSYLSINDSGGVLWPHIAAGTTREELAARLADEFAIAPERARADVDAFVGALAEHDLIEQ